MDDDNNNYNNRGEKKCLKTLFFFFFFFFLFCFLFLLRETEQTPTPAHPSIPVALSPAPALCDGRGLGAPAGHAGTPISTLPPPSWPPPSHGDNPIPTMGMSVGQHCPFSTPLPSFSPGYGYHRAPLLPSHPSSSFPPCTVWGGGGRLGLRWKLQRGNLMRSKPFVQMVKNAKTSKRQPGGDKRSNPFGPGQRGLGGGGDDSVLCHSLSPPRCHFSFEC